MKTLRMSVVVLLGIIFLSGMFFAHQDFNSKEDHSNDIDLLKKQISLLEKRVSTLEHRLDEMVRPHVVPLYK